VSVNKSVMILGSGRLSHRLSRFFRERAVNVIEIGSKEFKEIDETEIQESSMDYAQDLLIKKRINNVSAVCIVDSEDAVNLYLLMAVLAVREDVSVYATFFNDNLVSGLTSTHRNVKTYNPAIIVSKLFAEVIPKSLPYDDDNSHRILRTYSDSPGDGLIAKLIFGFIWLLVSGAVFFKITEQIDWQKSFYLVVTVITSVNFGDAGLKNYDPMVDLTRMGLMIATYSYVIVAFACIVDQMVKRRTDVLMFGRKKYNNRGHVIVCGLGRVGYAIVQELFSKGEDIIVIEEDQNNKYLLAVRASKVPVLIGDATLDHYLIDAGIAKAKALICAIDGDLANLEIGVNARVENNSIRLSLRISDQSTAEAMKKQLNIHHVFSKSHTTAKTICDQVCQVIYPQSLTPTP